MANLEQNNHFYDTPKGGEYTSSIGAVIWPPVEASFQRKKGFFGEVIADGNSLINFLKEFNQLPFGNTTRISARAIVNREALIEYLTLGLETSSIEAIIPLAGCGLLPLESTCLIYVGKNTDYRLSPEDIKNQQLQRVREIFGSSLENQSLRSLPDGFKIKLLTEGDRKNETTYEYYYQLYQLFGWSEQEVKSLLNNSNNILVAVFNEKGLVVSSGMAEIGDVSIVHGFDSLTLKLAEITEAATLPEYRGKGFYQKVSDEILRVLATMPNPPNLVFGELNLDSPGVLKVAAQQGRTSALQIALNMDLDPNQGHWFLEQHVPISSGLSNGRRDDYPYNNLMPAWFTQKELLQRYGK